MCFSSHHCVDCSCQQFPSPCVSVFIMIWTFMSTVSFSLCFSFHHMDCLCQQFPSLCLSVFIIWTAHVNSFFLSVFQFSPLHGLLMSTRSFSLCFSFHQYMDCSCQQFLSLCVSVLTTAWTVHINSYLLCVFQFSSWWLACLSSLWDSAPTSSAITAGASLPRTTRATA